jgi:toxin YhaV
MSVAVNGWRILLHPLVLQRMDEWSQQAQRGDVRAQKLLAGLRKLMLEVVPSDPGHPQFFLGHSMGAEFAHWRRAKMYQRYRLFFRFSSEFKTIVFVWINDESTLRTYGASSDAYAVFSKMVRRGTPPDDLDALLRESAAKG